MVLAGRHSCGRWVEATPRRSRYSVRRARACPRRADAALPCCRPCDCRRRACSRRTRALSHRREPRWRTRSRIDWKGRAGERWKGRAGTPSKGCAAPSCSRHQAAPQLRGCAGRGRRPLLRHLCPRHHQEGPAQGSLFERGTFIQYEQRHLTRPCAAAALAALRRHRRCAAARLDPPMRYCHAHGAAASPTLRGCAA